MKHNGNLQVAGRLSAPKLIVGDFVGTTLTAGSYQFPLGIGINGDILAISGGKLIFDHTLTTQVAQISGYVHQNTNSINTLFSTYANSTTVAAISAGLHTSVVQISGYTLHNTNAINTLYSTYTNSATTNAISAGLHTSVVQISGYTHQNTNGINTLFSTYANSTTVAAISAGLHTAVVQISGDTQQNTNSINTLFSTYANTTTVAAISAGLHTSVVQVSGYTHQNTNAINTLFSTYANSTTVAAISAGLQTQIDDITLQAGTNVIIVESPKKTWNISTLGGGGGGTGWVPIAGNGMSITPVTSASNLFTVIDYVSKTEVAAISAGLNTKAIYNKNDINNLYSSYANTTTVAAISAGLHSQIVAISGDNVIGPAEDGTYTDGLFVDFTQGTLVGTAVDRFNEVLKALAPQPAPALTTISINNTGVAGKLSFGPSNIISGYTNVPTLDVNSSVGTSQVIVDDGGELVTLKGIFNASTTFTGTLAANVSADSGSPTPSYPANAFNDGNSGTIQLWLNDKLIAFAILASTPSAITVANASGGLTLSATSPVKFPNGTTFPTFTYRTGTWNINPIAQVNGYNEVMVVRINGPIVNTNIFGWVVDNSVVSNTYSGETLSGLVMSGSKYISGINYNTSGVATYAISASNDRRNTYSSSASAISHSTTRCSIPSIALGTTTSEAQTDSISQVVTVSTSPRILNQSISANTLVSRTVQGNLSSSGVSNYAILLDAVAPSSSIITDHFDDEVFRISSDLNILTTSGYTSIGGSPSDWNSTLSIANSGATGYSDGLLQENSLLKYPTQGTNGGNYGAIANGPSNPDYSGATGNRRYLRFFYTPPSSPRSNFKLSFISTNTTFVPKATGLTGNNATLEILAPGTTSDGVDVVWKDASVAYTNDNSLGCYASSYGPTIPTNWGISLGGKDTSTSGNVIVIKITVASSWVGSIDNITLTWL